MWQVFFSNHDSIALEAPDAGTARILAQLQAWTVTGKMPDVTRVEPLPGTISALCSM